MITLIYLLYQNGTFLHWQFVFRIAPELSQRDMPFVPKTTDKTGHKNAPSSEKLFNGRMKMLRVSGSLFFSITDHVIILLKIIAFKFSYSRAYINENFLDE